MPFHPTEGDAVMKTKFWRGSWQGRLPDGDKYKRSRDVVRPTGGIVRGKFPSRKNGRMVQYEGLLELDAIYLFETLPTIVRYREQSLPINYIDGSKSRRYTPDFEVTLDTGEVLTVEVKPSAKLNETETGNKFKSIQNYYCLQNRQFVILTENELRREPRQSNARWIYHQAPRLPLSADAIEFAVHEIQHQLPAPISKVATLLEKRSVDPYSALIAGFLRCEVDVSISPETQLHINKENDDAWIFTTPELEV